MLGQGHFGICYQGSLNQHGETIDVAIKLLKESTDKEIFMSFIKEIKTLAYVGEHENVVKFYGAMVERIAESKERQTLIASIFHWLKLY